MFGKSISSLMKSTEKLITRFLIPLQRLEQDIKKFQPVIMQGKNILYPSFVVLA
jgi:hypothetical protein